MATKNLGGRGWLNPALAGLAAVAVGFSIFAMPNALFSGLVAQSGLPDILAAAQPPLGMKARGAAVAAGVILVFAAVVILLGALDRLSRRPKRKPAASPNFDTPKVRRADAHPDAPTRAPLLAGSELSEPFQEEEMVAETWPDESFEAEPAHEMFADLEARPLPGFLAVDQSALIASEEEEQDEEPLLLDQPVDDESIDALVAQLPEMPEMTGGESITDLMRRLESGLSRCEIGEENEPVEAEAEVQAEQWQDPEPEFDDQPIEEAAEADAKAQPWQQPEPVAEDIAPWQQPEPAAEAAAPEPQPVCEVPPVEAVETSPAPVSEPAEPSVGHRLRATIEEMQKVAARG